MEALKTASKTTNAVSIGRQAEYENVLAAHGLHDLNVCAVQSADSQGSVERHLHIAGAGGLHTRC